MAKFMKLALAAVAAAAVGGAQANVVIDLFNGSQGPATDNNGAGNVVWASQYGPDATVQGMYRDIGVQKTNNFANNIADTTAFVDSGVFSWSVDAGTTGRAVVRWDGNTDASAGPSTLTATAGPSGHFTSSGLGNGLGLALNLGDFFQFDVQVSDLDFTFWMELYNANGEFSKFKFESQAHFASVSTPIPVAAFAGLCAGGPVEFADPLDADNDDVIAGACSSAAFDIHNISAMQLIMESVSDAGSVDLLVSAVRVVPEPGMLALVGLGLLGAAGAARRRKAQ